jgi:hypothetical protein
MSDIPLLGQPKPEQLQPFPEASTVIDAEYAMLIYKTPDGMTIESDDIDLLIHVKRRPSLDEMDGLCANARKDFQATETTQTLMVRTAQMGQAMQQDVTNRHIQDQLNLDKQAAEAEIARKVEGHR